jgi:hypothetical protein
VLQVFGHQAFVGFGFFRFLPGGVEVGNGFTLAGSWQTRIANGGLYLA